MLRSIRTWLDHALFSPQTRVQWGLFLFIIALITISVFEIAVVSQYPEFGARYASGIQLFRTVIASIFVVEIALRILARAPRDYFLTWGALIDVVAVSPVVVGMFLPVGVADAIWLRAFRLVRLTRIGSLISRRARIEMPFLELLARLAPLAAWALGIKAIFLFAEQQGWWPEIEGLGVIITVVGFSIGILLSTRLSTVHNRMYTFDERLTHLVGSVEAARAYVSDEALLVRWLKIFNGKLRGIQDIHAFRRVNDELRGREGASIPAPIYNALHQNTQFLIHRASTRTPRLYVNLIKGMIAVYLAVVIVVIPGLTGLVSSVLVVYALGGMALIVEEMDQPVDNTGESLVNADVRRLEEYIVNMENELKAARNLETKEEGTH